MNKSLTNKDIANAAAELGVDIASIKAFLTVEAPRGGFQDDGQVTILFEPHKFSQYTNGRYDKIHPDLSYPVWGTRPYGSYASQHTKLQRAAALNRDAALRATSWGIPQVLGNNWKKVGASSLQDFINRMHRSEGSQLEIMVAFIKSDKELWNALKARDWDTVARKYNGTAYRKNEYHLKLAKAWRQHSGMMR